MAEHDVALRSDLRTVYVDPISVPGNVLAYYPETHASSRCSRTYRGGRRVDVAELSDPVWCEQCTTENPQLATVRWVDGAWSRRI